MGTNSKIDRAIKVLHEWTEKYVRCPSPYLRNKMDEAGKKVDALIEEELKNQREATKCKK